MYGVRAPHGKVGGSGGVAVWRLLLVAAATIVGPEAVRAQAGVVQGRVHDTDGAAVYGATVLLARGDDVLRAADSDRLGSFRLADVPPGPYTVRARALGYTEHVGEIVLGLAETIDLDISLERSALLLEGIEVEAERARERIRFEEIGGATVREMELTDLRAVPGVAEPDPVRAIEVLPGVVSTSDFSAAYHVRGGSQDQNLILLDGVPIFSPFHLGGLFSVFNADMIDRVELQSGGFPAEHGGRVSSVLQIESDPGEGDFGVDGAVSLLASRAAVGGRLDRGAAQALGFTDVRYRFSARRSYFDVLFKPAFDFPYHLTDLQTIVEGWTAGGNRFTITAYSGRDVFDLTRLDPEDFPLRIDWDWGNDAIGARWVHPHRGGGSLDIRANYSRYGTGLLFPDFSDTELDSRIGQGQLRVDLDVRPVSDLTFQTGVELDRLRYRNLFATGGTEFTSSDGRGWLLGVYAQTDWSKPGAWLVELGLRADGFRPDPGTDVLELAPRVAVKRFFAGGDAAVKVAVGRYTQFLHSLRDEELPLGLDLWVVSGDRAPHTVSDQIQVGIEGYRGDSWFWSLEGYARGFDGVVAFNPADDPNDDLDNILTGSGSSWGIDALVRREIGTVRGWAALSWLKAERTFPDVLSPVTPSPEISYPPIFDRRLDADLILQYPAPWGWEGGLRWNFGTGIPYTRALGSYGYYSPRYVEGGGLEWTGDGGAAETGVGVVLADRNANRYPMYHRLDVSFRKTVEKGWGTLVPYVNLVNVYNRRNVLFYFFDYETNPATRSGVSMFPVLPTFGLEVRF